MLGDLAVPRFLAEFWQKKPRLIRQVAAGPPSFISPEGVKELCCRSEVESRLVLEKDGEYPWQVVHGPFERARLDELPASNWTLLVQNANLHLEGADELLRRFAFLPNWRIDDVMISLAAPGGGAGPHLDSYDVFLLQAHGRRRWSINHTRYTDSDFIPGLDLRILRDFRGEEEWSLDPGDMLYLPAGVAHHGVALDECITCSIGFRAPSRLELLGRFLDEGGVQDVQYTDAQPDPGAHPGEITSPALAAIRDLLHSTLADGEAINHWFGRSVTQLPENVDVPHPAKAATPEMFLNIWRSRGAVQRGRLCRAAFIRGPGAALTLFVNGQSFLLPAAAEALVLDLTGSGVVRPGGNVEETTLQVLCDLYNTGAIVLPGAPEAPY